MSAMIPPDIVQDGVAYPVREVIAWGEQNGLQQQTVAA